MEFGSKRDLREPAIFPLVVFSLAAKEKCLFVPGHRC